MQAYHSAEGENAIDHLAKKRRRELRIGHDE